MALAKETTWLNSINLLLWGLFVKCSNSPRCSCCRLELKRPATGLICEPLGACYQTWCFHHLWNINWREKKRKKRKECGRIYFYIHILHNAYLAYILQDAIYSPFWSKFNVWHDPPLDVQGHMKTEPPWEIPVWLVFALGAPTTTLILQGGNHNIYN